jgi:hypothetical protein
MQLKKTAPTLGGSRRNVVTALFAAIIAVLAVSAFYFTIKIIEAIGEQRDQDRLIAVEPAGHVPMREVELALARIAAEEAAEEVAYEHLLQEIRATDLLGEMDLEKPEPGASSPGESDPGESAETLKTWSLLPIE